MATTATTTTAMAVVWLRLAATGALGASSAACAQEAIEYIEALEQADCERCAELETELASERARRTLGGVPPVPAQDWGNLARTPPPETAADAAAPPLHRTTIGEVTS